GTRGRLRRARARRDPASAGFAGAPRAALLPWLRRGLERAPDREGDALPAFRLGLQLPAPGARQLVVLRAPLVLGVAPLGGEPTLFFQAIERGKQRAGLDDERAVRDLLDAAGDPEAVLRPERE